MIKAKLRVVRRGETVKKYARRIKDEMSGPYVTVGFHSDTPPYSNGVSVVEVAFWNEFGTRYIPERPFIRTAVSAGMEEMNKVRQEALKMIQDRKIDVTQGLKMIGMRMQILVQNQISSNMPPPNAASTLREKKRQGEIARTLIATGQMLRSVTYKVFPQGGGGHD